MNASHIARRLVPFWVDMSVVVSSRPDIPDQAVYSLLDSLSLLLDVLIILSSCGSFSQKDLHAFE